MNRYSGFPFVEKLSKLSTSAITKNLTTWFNTFGWPERIRTDNGPQYRSEFDEFCAEHSIVHENSSPYFPQSNGLSEAAVKQMKFLLKKCKENRDEFSDALLEFRNTPNVSGRSPNQMFYGRRLRGRLPHLPGANDLDIKNAIAGADHRKTLMEYSTVSGTPLTQFPIGQRVLLQHPLTKSWDSKGRVTGMRPNGRSYDILLDSGKSFIRNRAYMRPIDEDEVDGDPDDHVNVDDVQPRRSARIASKNSGN